MTSYDSPSAPHNVAPWPYSSAPGQPSYEAPRPGLETRQVLLTLGGLCLVVGFSAGTALVWAGLGRGGQVALMVSITGVLLAGAATVRRLPATAEALGGVGLAGCVIDAIAARTLHLPAAAGLPLHVYTAISAVGVAAVAVVLSAASPRLVSAPIAWSGALLVAAVAALDPTDLDRTALLAPVSVGVATLIDHALRRSGPLDAPARVVNAVGAAAVAVVGYWASLLASAQHDPAGLCGVTVPLALLALPLLAGRASWVADDTTAALSGISAATLVIAAGIQAGSNVRTAAAIALPVLAIYVQLPDGTGWTRRIQIAVSAIGIPGALAWMSLAADTPRFAGIDFALAVAAAGLGGVWPQSRAGSTSVRAVALSVAIALASIAAGITLDLHGVTTAEAYVATPAGLILAWGAVLLMRDRRMPSTVLAPGLGVGLLPTVLLALGNDHGRQAVALVAATVIVYLGAELRLAVPLLAGAGIIGAVSLRVAGPHIVELPHWLMWFAAGTVLLTLGATWEARLADAHRLTGLIRPRLEALR